MKYQFSILNFISDFFSNTQNLRSWNNIKLFYESQNLEQSGMLLVSVYNRHLRRPFDSWFSWNVLFEYFNWHFREWRDISYRTFLSADQKSPIELEFQMTEIVDIFGQIFKLLSNRTKVRTVWVHIKLRINSKLTRSVTPNPLLTPTLPSRDFTHACGLSLRRPFSFNLQYSDFLLNFI